MKMKRIILCLLVILCLAAVFPLGAYASTEDTVTGNTESATEVHNELTDEDENAIENDTPTSPNVDEYLDPDNEDTVADLVDEPNPFAVFFEGVKTYATEIISAVTLIASLILAHAYKSGLTPMITNALSNLGKLLAGMRDSVSENEKASKEITEALEARLAAAEETVERLTAGIEAVSKTMKAEEDSTAEKKRLGEILTAQIDMMYELFISSALPEYQKEAVAERIKEMKEAIADAEQ